MMDKEKKWFVPDDTWEVLGINSRDDYDSKFIVTGKFHEFVPDVIKKEFCNVEYLTAYAYFHMPLYNEAFNKCMRILEISVKQKATLLQIITSQRNGKSKSLDYLITEICNQKHYEYFKDRFDWFRKLRNYEMHPSQGSMLGAFLNHKAKMLLFVNMINELFQDEQIRIKNKLYSETIEKKITAFGQSHFLVQVDTSIMIGHTIAKSKVIATNQGNVLILGYLPAFRDAYNSISQKKYLRAILLKIRDFEIADCIGGVSFYNEAIKIYRESNTIFEQNYEEFINEYNRLTEGDKEGFKFYLEQTIETEIEKLKYELEVYS